MSAASFILLGFIVLTIMFVIMTYNKLVRLRSNQKNSFAQIDVQLTRRYELIPNLVETAKAFMKHEQETLEKVIMARNQAFVAKQNMAVDPASASAMAKLIAAEGAVKSSLGSFMAISESYPELRSNENMKTLMEELSSTENKVAFARQSYNDMTMEYNIAREVFPANIIAGMFSFAPAALFEVEDPKAKQAVKVSF
jgi:LemA protein